MRAEKKRGGLALQIFFVHAWFQFIRDRFYAPLLSERRDNVTTIWYLGETRMILKINIWFFLEMKINNQTKGMLQINMQTIGLLRKIVHVYENGIKPSCGIYIYIIYVYKIITVRRDVTNENIFFFKSSLPPPDFQSNCSQAKTVWCPFSLILTYSPWVRLPLKWFCSPR